jgi:small subunit ribosomal protein S21
MPLVKVKENGSFENAVRKFKKQCDNEGIISEVRSRLHYDKPSVKKKKKSIAARKKIIKSLRSSR